MKTAGLWTVFAFDAYALYLGVDVDTKHHPPIAALGEAFGVPTVYIFDGVNDII